MLRRSFLLMLLLALCAMGAASSGAETVRSAGGCWTGYSYAGLSSVQSAHGISATISTASLHEVASGHVAAWVGVGGAGAGPHGSDEWLQVGVSGIANGGWSLYYEVARPGHAAKYVKLQTQLSTASRHRFSVLEIRSRPGWWRAWVDEKRVSKPFHMAGAWRPMSTAESWNDNQPVCNPYHFTFGRVDVARDRGGSWTPLRDAHVLQDPGYRVVRTLSSSFVARTA